MESQPPVQQTNRERQAESPFVKPMRISPLETLFVMLTPDTFAAQMLKPFIKFDRKP